jgi:branched-chain amino acid transport system permease protein
MASLVEHVVAGLAAGGLYALLALGLVLVRRSTGVVNVAQAELATLSAFVCFALTDRGWAFWPAFGATLLLSLAGGIVLYLGLVRPLGGGVLLAAGLFLVVAGLDSWIWGAGERHLRGPFSTASVHVFGAALPKVELGVLVVTLAAATAAHGVYRHTRLGLGMRAVEASTAEARAAGVSTRTMHAASWGLAALLGAVAGTMAAQLQPLDPGMLRLALLYALAAALLGALVSPAAAVAGGLAIGAALELLGAYAHLGADLRPAVTLAIVFVCAAVRRP